MSDKPSNDNTDKTSNTPDDQFSLNHFESNDDTDADAFHHLIQEDGQQEPIVPADFDDAGYDMDDMDGDQTEANALFDDGDFEHNTDASEYFDEADEAQANATQVDSSPVGGSPEHAADDGEADAESKPWLMFVVVAVVVLGIVAWLNMGEDESNEIVPATELSMPPVVHLDSTQGLPIDQRQPGEENTLSHVQQRLSVMEERFDAQKQQAGNVKPASAVDIQPETRPVKESMQPTTHAVQFAKAEKPLRSSRKQVKQAVGWVVVIASVNSRAAAIKHVDQLKSKAIEADIYPTSVNGNAMYRIGVGGFASHDEAAAQKKYLVHKLGVKGAWLYKAE